MKTKPTIIPPDEVRRLWDKAWADYLQTVKEQKLEEKQRLPDKFWHMRCGI